MHSQQKPFRREFLVFTMALIRILSTASVRGKGEADILHVICLKMINVGQPQSPRPLFVKPILSLVEGAMLFAQPLYRQVLPVSRTQGG